MNKVILMGNIASEIKSQTANGKTFAGFTLAVNKYSKDGQNSANFFRVKAAGKTAENIIKYFAKGKPILIEGQLSQEKWGDKEVVCIFCQNFHFVGSKKESESSSSDNSNGGLW